MASTNRSTASGQAVAATYKITAAACSTFLPDKVVEVTKDDCLQYIESSKRRLKSLEKTSRWLKLYLVENASIFEDDCNEIKEDQTEFEKLQTTINQDMVSADTVRSSLCKSKELLGVLSEKWEKTKVAVYQMACDAPSSSTPNYKDYTKKGTHLLSVDVEKLNKGRPALTAFLEGLASRYQGYLDPTCRLQSEIAECFKKAEEIWKSTVQGLAEIQKQEDILKADTSPAHEVMTAMTSLPDMAEYQASLQSQDQRCEERLYRAVASWKQQDMKTLL